ncbi:MAG: DNA protecting protein DprA [Beggiatoa sp. IS2]|nr:MAG: DNA protecting protein DprA [Beggiatoa sp. IS2]
MADRPDEAYWLALLRAPGVGPVTFARLTKHFGSPQAVLMAGTSAWRELNLKDNLLNYLQSPDWRAVEQDLNWATQNGQYLLTLEHPNYPDRLRQIHDAPPILFVRGDYKLLDSVQLAMVGTRNASQQGQEIAFVFAKQLSLAGLMITSGLALGIDAASHHGALAGSGNTIAVLATGMDQIYPRQHTELAERIAEKGALVSESFWNTPASRENFPRRNRIISGLSVGTLVVEAGARSGALITAHQAVEQGREVFAVPGSIYHPATRGCHTLIKQGAKLVETAEDVLEELRYPHSLPGMTPAIANKPVAPAPLASVNYTDLDADYLRLLEYLSEGPSSIDNLVERSRLTPQVVSSMLLILEMRQLVTLQPGGLYTRLSVRT